MKKKESAVIDVNSTSAPNNLQLKDILESEAGFAASHIFGSECISVIQAGVTVAQDITQKSIAHHASGWIHTEISNMEPALHSVEEDNRPGRIGVPEVRFDSTAQVGTMMMSADRLHAQSQSNFSTVRANVCFYSGLWQYELQLESKGVMQVGWAMADSEFTTDSGVGDTIRSFGYDGNRVRKWNLTTTEYGEAWQGGDIIGCLLDLDHGSIRFHRNGKDLGEAFSSIPTGSGCAYFPSISLASDEKLQANFGSVPFKYPVDGYLPVQQPPTAHILRAQQLLHWFSRAASFPRDKGGESEAVVLLFCEILVFHLSTLGLLSRAYVIDFCIVPFLYDISSQTTHQHSLSKLHLFCDCLAVFLQPEDFEEFVKAVCTCLQQRISLTSVSLDYTRQKQCLLLFCDIYKNANVRLNLLKQILFMKSRVPELMEVRPLDLTVMKEIVPQAWWKQDQSINAAERSKSKYKEYETKKKNYLGYCQYIKTKVMELEAFQEMVLRMFLNNTDSSETEASSRKHFLHMFRIFLKDNHLTGMVSSILNNRQLVDQTPLPTALNYFHRLVSVVRELWSEELAGEPVFVPLRVFCSGEVNYFNIERVGGVLSYLIHTLQTPLIQELGENRPVQDTSSQPPSNTLPTVQIQIRGIDATGQVSTITRWINYSGSVDQQQQRHASVPLGMVGPASSLAELLDGVIMLYSIAAHKQLQKVSSIQEEMDKYIKTLIQAKTRLNKAKQSNSDSTSEIENSIQILERKIEEQSQVGMAWVRGAVYTAEKRADCVWLLRAVLLTLETASRNGQLFAFVPDFYLETLTQLCSALRNLFHPTLPLDEMDGHKELLVQACEFMVNHLTDPRMVSLNCKDMIMESLAGFVSKQLTVDCLESISKSSQDVLVRLLLMPYENRPWGQTNWILMRIWHGCGFAFRYQRSPHLERKLAPRTHSAELNTLIHQCFDPCPSAHYQQLVAQTLYSDEQAAAEFLNSLLKQLNWSFSEFISMIQEIHNLSKRPERVIIEARQLKICATCFDFVINLLRVLEMICTCCPRVFTDPARDRTEILLERLCQLIGQILLRITAPTGSFNHVVALEVPDLNSIDQFPVLAAVVGVLVALLAEDIDSDKKVMSLAAKCLLSEAAFHLDNLKYTLGEIETTSDGKDFFSLTNYPEAVTADELGKVRRLVSVLTKYQARMSTVKEVEDDDLCLICCAMPLAVTFTPCNHQSCKSCIAHHLMNCKECFFCKTVIRTVVATDGKLLFDSSTSVQKPANVIPENPPPI